MNEKVIFDDEQTQIGAKVAEMNAEELRLKRVKSMGEKVENVPSFVIYPVRDGDCSGFKPNPEEKKRVFGGCPTHEYMPHWGNSQSHKAPEDKDQDEMQQ